MKQQIKEKEGPIGEGRNIHLRPKVKDASIRRLITGVTKTNRMEGALTAREINLG